MNRREWVEDGVICEEVAMTADEFTAATERLAALHPAGWPGVVTIVRARTDGGERS